MAYRIKDHKNGEVQLPIVFAIEFISCKQDSQGLEISYIYIYKMDNYDTKINKWHEMHFEEHKAKFINRNTIPGRLEV